MKRASGYKIKAEIQNHQYLSLEKHLRRKHRIFGSNFIPKNDRETRVSISQSRPSSAERNVMK